MSNSSFSVFGLHVTCEGDHTFKYFLLRSPEGSLLHRSYHDLLWLSREVSHRDSTSTLKFPTGRVKNLMKDECSWCVDGDGWKPHYKKSVGVLNEWLSQVSLHAHHLMDLFCDEEQYRLIQEKIVKRKQMESGPRELQQYFSSSSNVEYIVGLAKSQYSEDTIFVEPSCGDGRVVVALAKCTDSCYVVGNDVDVIEASKAAEHAAREFPHKCHIRVSDYLSTNRDELLSHIPNHEQKEVVVVANPPFTSGGGAGGFSAQGASTNDIDRDYPLRFVCHSALEMKPTRMIFLNPARCAHENFLKRASDIINCHCDTMNDKCVCMCGKYKWEVETTHPPNTVFEFCGRLVRQPVV
eukprot:CAMPEP_0185041728 /NCGR_PEP_ID=MMETSP1103-20130426/41400_1 /TAXON_ID=36769 /ORGANISM="Paraphysomonas bandaiensis, Strain Caron Lab Isolate" /LENGTH=351 /DNA_ID=CAMNT_0027581587 /DNA_START=58 /DNA_END=1110 /DNA_ORIENTATION=+